jgi:hypothetical protein
VGEIDRNNFSDLLGRVVVCRSPYFSSIPAQIQGTVAYVENSEIPHMIVVQEEGTGYMEMVDIDHYADVSTLD